MQTSDEVKNNYNYNDIKSISVGSIARRPFLFYSGGEKHAFVTLDEHVIDKLKLTRNDLFFQEVEGENIILRRYRNTQS
jgi:hypothetical protein